MPLIQKWEWRKNDELIQTVHLSRDFKVYWGDNKVPCGRWDYKYHEDVGGFLILEFSSRNAWRWRKHILEQTSDCVAELLPASHPMYEAACWYPESLMHTNRCSDLVTMVKIPGPAAGPGADPDEKEVED